MREGYIVNPTIGAGCFIEVHNWKGLNEIGHFRYTKYRNKKTTSIGSNLIGIWKPKKIKNEQ